MDTDRKALHRSEYVKYSVDELAMLIDRLVSDPARYTPEARDALKEVLIERNLDAGTLLKNLRAEELKDHQTILAKEQKRKIRSTTFHRRLGRVLAFIGIPMSILVGWLSISQSHLGGLIGSVAWMASSIWMGFYYQGD